MRKIFFIIPQLSQPRCIKRVNAFYNNGFDVEVYGFENGLYSKNTRLYPCEIHRYTVNGRIPKNKAIRQNIRLVREVRNVLKKDDIVYIFGIEFAVYYKIFGGGNQYIYEQADLNYTKLRNKSFVSLFAKLDKYLISRSYNTVLTSQGFVNYLYGEKQASSKIVLLENRLNKELECFVVKDHSVNPNAIRFAFVGAVRYPKTILTFAKVVAERYPNHQFHFYGEGLSSNLAKELCDCYPNNLFYHGGFSNPGDLPSIYSEVDLNIVCYDTASMNVRIAEPNKLYESIFFKVPLVVSTSTFLEKKVFSMGVGFSIDSTNEDEICSFIESLDKDSFDKCQEAMRKVPKESLFDNTDELISRIKYKQTI